MWPSPGHIPVKIRLLIQLIELLCSVTSSRCYLFPSSYLRWSILANAKRIYYSTWGTRENLCFRISFLEYMKSQRRKFCCGKESEDSRKDKTKQTNKKQGEIKEMIMKSYVLVRVCRIFPILFKSQLFLLSINIVSKQ